MILKNSQIGAIFISFSVIQIFTILSSFFYNLKGGSVDAERFNYYAFEWVKSGQIEFVVNAEFFIQYLGIIYWIFFPSEYLGSQFGILALFISTIYFIKIGKLLQIQIPAFAIILFLLWPSTLLRVSTTLREPYLILFTILICYHLIKYQIFGRNSNILYVLIFCIFGFLFHKAFTILIAFLILYISMISAKRTNLIFRFLILSILSAAVLFVVKYYGNVRGLHTLTAAVSGDTEYITSVLESKSGREFRSTHGVTLNFNSPISFILSIPDVFSYYMFGPFFWKVRNIYDAMACLEGIIRFIALWIILKYIFVKKIFPFYIKTSTVLILALCMIWASGTTNYGTASRHHVTTNWFFIIILVMYIKRRYFVIYRPQKQQMDNPYNSYQRL